MENLTAEQQDQIKDALQRIYDLAQHIGNYSAFEIIDEVVKINEVLEIEILM